MRSNVEVKLRCDNLAAVRHRALAAGAADAGLLVQVDTFYRSATGRLKLREIVGDHAELIWYDRPDAADVRMSEYVVTPVADVATMHAALNRSNGIRGVVRKRRDLLLWRNVRVHLDAVDGLGTFVELESVVGEVDADTARRHLDEMLDTLGLRDAEVVPVAYADLLDLV